MTRISTFYHAGARSILDRVCLTYASIKRLTGASTWCSRRGDPKPLGFSVSIAWGIHLKMRTPLMMRLISQSQVEFVEALNLVVCHVIGLIASNVAWMNVVNSWWCACTIKGQLTPSLQKSALLKPWFSNATVHYAGYEDEFLAFFN